MLRTLVRDVHSAALLRGLAGALAIAALADGVAASPIVRVAAYGADRPTWAAAAPGDASRFYVLEQETGRIRVLDLATSQYRETPFLTVPDLSTSFEAGLLCMAFHPQYPDSAYAYVFYTGQNYAGVIERHTVSPDGERAIEGSARLVLTYSTPGLAHHGGWLGFGLDGYLYVSIGDGGGPGDSGPGHDPLVGNAQSDTTRRGKILRLDVDHGTTYAIPSSNPNLGEPSPTDEIWAKGLRNPWRCSIDRGTGDLYIGDVGQGTWEEIDYMPAGIGGANFGWRKFEGPGRFNCPNPCDSSGLTRPIHFYTHDDDVRCAVMAGFVYRGSAMPDLVGQYFFADYCSGQVWTLRVAGGAATEFRERTAEIHRGYGTGIQSITSFAEDAEGELYLICQDTYGTIYKIVPDSTLLDVPREALAAPLSLGPVKPNPSGGPFSFRVEAPAGDRARLRVYDANGRLVRGLADWPAGPVAREVWWNARDDRGAPVRAGVYYLKLESGAAVRTTKVAVTR